MKQIQVKGLKNKEHIKLVKKFFDKIRLEENVMEIIKEIAETQIITGEIIDYAKTRAFKKFKTRLGLK